MVEQMVGIKRHIQLFLKPETNLLHLQPVIFDVGIRRDIDILTQANSDFMDLRRTHHILQPLINRQPVHQRKTDFLQVVIRKSPFQIGEQIYGRVEGQSDLPHGLVIVSRIGIHRGIHLILEPHSDLLHLQPVKFGVGVNRYIQPFLLPEFDFLSLRFLILVIFHHRKMQFLLFFPAQITHNRYQSFLIHNEMHISWDSLKIARYMPLSFWDQYVILFYQNHG